MTTPTTQEADTGIHTTMDFGCSRGDYSAMVQWQRNADGSYTLLSVKSRRQPPIRSKAQVKRILKRQKSVLGTSPLRLGLRKDGAEIYPVNWMEIAAYNIKVAQ